MSILNDANALSDELVTLRRSLHQEPELGLDLPRTQEKVLAALDGLPLEITLGKNLSSVTAVLRGGRPGGAVLLRGDMDGLPVQEASGVEYSSRIAGHMHACGHDLHTAGLVGAAKLLSERRSQLHGDVVFMFQPGEEGHNGAGLMIEEGVLNAAGKPLDAAYAIHVAANRLPHGIIATRPGTVSTASDELHVTVRGRGGHGSAPHVSLDPIPATCEMITAIQTWVTRSFDIHDPVVVTVGRLQAGTKANVIPDTTRFEATIRSLSEESRDRLAAGLPRLVRGIAAAHGLDVDVDYVRQYPVTVNNASETTFALDHAREIMGPQRVWLAPNPASGSEDFAFVLQQVPGAMLLLGAVPPGQNHEDAPMNHSPRAVFDDTVLADQAAVLTELAVERLAETAA
ncbi:amidohydrolase [Nocardia sp. ET3-3]|uniref:Amidohydrolase n=1 Tax=Nocardia terrae TaxID=2675851 RepID=A0A7K1USD3_9NOCA|nr:M20 family metallopeptidase [Nocardia terrae]MVU77235.1 amidohydrolase [Nocardia terrae]